MLKDTSVKKIKSILSSIGKKLASQGGEINENFNKVLSSRMEKSNFDEKKYISSLKFNVILYKVSIRNREMLLGKWIKNGNIPDSNIRKTDLEKLSKICRDYVQEGMKSGGKKFKEVDLKSLLSYENMEKDALKKKLELEYKTLYLYNDVLSILINALKAEVVTDLSNEDIKEVMKLIRLEIRNVTSYIMKSLTTLSEEKETKKTNLCTEKQIDEPIFKEENEAIFKEENEPIFKDEDKSNTEETSLKETSIEEVDTEEEVSSQEVNEDKVDTEEEIISEEELSNIEEEISSEIEAETTQYQETTEEESQVEPTTKRKKKKLPLIAAALVIGLGIGIGGLYLSGVISNGTFSGAKISISGKIKGDDGRITNNPDEYIVEDSDFRYLTVSELEEYSDKELAYARNEIFARYGYVFDNKDYKEFFGNKTWYAADEDFSGDEQYFNDYEKANIRLIASLESTRQGKVADEFKDYFMVDEDEGYIEGDLFDIIAGVYEEGDGAKELAKALEMKKINCNIFFDGEEYKVSVGSEIDIDKAKEISNKLKEFGVDTDIQTYSYY